jgi:uncharacterized protein YegL
MELLIHDKNTFPISLPHSINLNGNNEFCIFNINMQKEDIIHNYYWNIVFTIDCSGSMSDKCKDDRTKMQHIKHTITSILHQFSQNDTHIFNVCVACFDETINELFDFTIVNNENIDKLITKINSIYPKTTTNLIAPLKYSKDKYKKFIEIKQKFDAKQEVKYKLDNNDDYISPYKFIHIHLTDGDDTSGNTEDQLVDEVCHDFKNIFIGFGKDHNSLLMENMCGGICNEYKYIDILECAGLVYGEIIHSLLYLVYEYTTINIENGLIYDYINNIWVNKLDIGYVIADKPRSFHIKTTTEKLNLMKINIVSTGKVHIYSCNNNIEKNDLTKYLYRQKVLELLYEAKKAKKLREKKEIRNKLKVMFDLLKNKMVELNVEDDPFWKVMCDDLYITCLTITSKHAHMYLSARLTSQGQQNAYNVTSINYEDISNTFNTRRNFTIKRPTPRYISLAPLSNTTQVLTLDTVDDFNYNEFIPLNENNMWNYMDNYDDDDDKADDNETEEDIFVFDNDNYNISSNTTSPYYTKSVSEVMFTTQNNGNI